EEPPVNFTSRWLPTFVAGMTLTSPPISRNLPATNSTNLSVRPLSLLGDSIETICSSSTRACGICSLKCLTRSFIPIVYNRGAMKLAILGTRGIPANYGGFETFAEELATRLAARGHDVTVYGRSNNIRYPQKIYKGVRLVVLPTIGTKHLDTIAHTFFSVLHAVPQRFDCILLCNAANAIFALMPRFTGTPSALNVDGIERLRKKWGAVARAYYRISECLATIIP